MDSGIVSPLQLRWVKGVCIFGRMTRFLYVHCSNPGVEQTPHKSQYMKLTQEKKILLPLLLGFKLATFLP